ncbi:MAG: DUF5309 domain-containing protein [Gammaproteobacteria bacterium]|nr:DUF5309 domain-containing protein [Gammaproteobacteria bacterium]
MAAPANTFDTYESIGNREDLANLIYDVSPSDTPFLSAIKKTKATATNHEFQTDALSAAAANAQVEGDDAAAMAITPTVRLGNQSQILSKTIISSGTQEKISKAGRKSELAYQVAREMKSIKLDLEWAMMDGGGTAGIGNAKAVGNATTAREMGSIQTYITSNASVGAGSGAVSSGDGTDTMTAGTARDFTEALLTTVLSSCYTNGGNPSLLFVSATNKGVVSTFTGGGTHYVDKDDKKLVNTVEIYTGDFHTLKVIPSRQMANEIVLAIDPEYVACAELRGLSLKELARSGDSEKRQMVMEATLQVSNEAAHGIVADTNG